MPVLAFPWITAMRLWASARLAASRPCNRIGRHDSHGPRVYTWLGTQDCPMKKLADVGQRAETAPRYQVPSGRAPGKCRRPNHEPELQVLALPPRHPESLATGAVHVSGTSQTTVEWGTHRKNLPCVPLCVCRASKIGQRAGVTLTSFRQRAACSGGPCLEVLCIHVNR